MSSEWVLQRLSTLGTFERGKSKHRPRDAEHLYGGPYPFIQTGDVTASGGRITSYRQTYSEAGLAQSKLWPVNTLCITIAANIAETGLLTFPACFPDSVVGFTADPKKADIRFIEYIFQAFRASVKSKAYGSVQENINLEVLRNLEFPIPSLNNQKKIADFFTLIDDRIALLRETNATLEAIAQALFKSWFVDFDPVHANAVFLENGQAPSLPAEIQALFPSRLVESPQGLIPEGWELKTIDDISEILNGFAFKSGDYVQSGDGVFVLRTKNFDDSGYAVKLEKDVYLPESFMQSHAKYLCQPYDFHLVMVGASVGHTSLLLPSLLPALRNQNMWCFRERHGFPSKFFVHEVVKMNVADALRTTSGSAREFFRKGDFGLRKVLVPDNTILEKFEDNISCFKESVSSNTIKIETLTELRDTLLPRLISGQLRLPDTEAVLAEVS